MEDQEKAFPELSQEALEAVTGGIKLGTGIFGQKKEFPDHIILSGNGKIASPFEAKNIIAAKQNEELYTSKQPTTPKYKITFEKHHGMNVPLAWNGAEPAIVDSRNAQA